MFIFWLLFKKKYDFSVKIPLIKDHLLYIYFVRWSGFLVVAKPLYNYKYLFIHIFVCQLRLKGNIINSSLNFIEFIFLCTFLSYIRICNLNILSICLSVKLQKYKKKSRTCPVSVMEFDQSQLGKTKIRKKTLILYHDFCV